MIRMTVTSQDGKSKLLLLGVDRENINRLTAGQPIFVDGAAMGVGFDVAMMFGETLADCYAEMEKCGLGIPPKGPGNDR